MSSYYMILVWLGIYAIASQVAQVQQTEIVCGKRVKRYNKVWAFIGVVPLIYYVSMRDYWIGDTGVYINTFKNMPESFDKFSSYLAGLTKDKGFYGFSCLIKIFITENPICYFLILAIIQAGILMYVYRRYSSRYIISLFLFFASTDYISWMFNGVRQFTAVVLTFACCGLILEKKYISAIIVSLLASTFHGTALLVIPFMFITQGKAWNKKTLMFIAAIIIVVASVGEFTNILDSMLQETQYENVVSDWTEWEDDGTNVFRVAVYAVPMILSLIGLKYIRQEDNAVINLCVNMSIVSVGFYVVSMFTSGIFIGRLPIYFSLYNYILLPWEIDHIFERKSAMLVYISMLVAYIGFYVYSLSMMGL